MAQVLEVSCRSCGACHTQLDGPVFAGYRPRCQRCGRARLVDWADHASELGGALPDRETLDTWLSEQAGTCSCGGRFSRSAPLRCPACRSTDVDTTMVGTAD